MKIIAYDCNLSTRAVACRAADPTPLRGQGRGTEIRISGNCLAGNHSQCYKLACTCTCHLRDEQ